MKLTYYKLKEIILTTVYRMNKIIIICHNLKIIHGKKIVQNSKNLNFRFLDTIFPPLRVNSLNTT